MGAHTRLQRSQELINKYKKKNFGGNAKRMPSPPRGKSKTNTTTNKICTGKKVPKMCLKNKAVRHNSF